jgi:hypothetical protein
MAKKTNPQYQQQYIHATTMKDGKGPTTQEYKKKSVGGSLKTFKALRKK